MELGLKGKKAFVTGGASGIGRAIAIDLAKEGVTVAVTSRKAEGLEKILDELGGAKNGHRVIQTGLAEEGEPQRVAQQLWKEFGKPDILVNNVGHTLDVTDPFCPISDWRKIFRLNLEVHVELNNLFLPHMIEQKWGRIVNISAGASLENSGPVPYCASKAALTAYTRSMGRVLAPQHVVMSALLPGVVITEEGHWVKVMEERPEHAEKYLAERCPLKRFGTTSEVSPMVVLLCSELASFCQGAIWLVDGGQAKHYVNINGV